MLEEGSLVATGEAAVLSYHQVHLIPPNSAPTTN